jgi:hypothetical protein
MGSPSKAIKRRGVPRTSKNPQLQVVDRLDLVSLQLNCQNGKYYTGYWDAEVGKVIRKSAKTRDYRTALRLAKKLDTVLRRLGTRNLGYKKKEQSLTLEKALDLGIKRSRADRVGLMTLALRKKYFLDYMRKHHPAVKYWTELLPIHVDGYCKFLSETPGPGGKRRAASSQKKYLGVIRMASQVLCENYPDTYRPLSVKHAVGESTRRPKFYLSPEQMLRLLETAIESENVRMAWVVLMGTWAGLRFTEICARTAADFRDDCVLVADPDKRLGGKTRSSQRVVPLCAVAAKAARELLSKDNLRDIAGRDTRLVDICPERLRQDFSDYLKSLGITFQGRDVTRKSYANLLKVSGVQYEVRNATMGWSFRGVGGNHYEDWSIHPEEFMNAPQVAGPKLRILRTKGSVLVDEYLSQNLSQKRLDDGSCA